MYLGGFVKRALIIGSSGGIGSAVCEALGQAGADVTALSRRADGLDVTDEASVARHLGGLTGTFDLILLTTGALEIAGATPEKTIRDLSPRSLADQFAVNAIGPAMVIKHAWPLIPRDRRSVIAVLSARVGSIGDNRLGGWYAYRSAKAAVNQIVHTAAIELGRTHKQAICVSLHPGTVQTPFTQKYLGRHPSVPPNEAAENLLAVIDGLMVEQSGGFYDWAGREVAW